ncbi:MAG: hypothetical protein V7609_1129 [Verrucomicrobiota bacterium]
MFCVSLLLYVWTLAPTVTLIDSGELIVAARNLGVAHPPGFPLYLILAHLASLVPLGNIAVRIHFASAVFAALASAMLTLVMAELLITTQSVAAAEDRGRNNSLRSARKARATTAPASLNDMASSKLIVLIPALASGLVMAFSRTLWSYATIAEVYTLNTLLVLIIFFLILRWRRRIIEARARTGAANVPILDYDYLLYSAAVLFGLALGVHHVTVGLTLPALAVIVYRTQGPRFFVSARILYAAVLSFAALLAVYTYLPLAAARAPILNWGDPRSLHAIWSHITGKQYQVFFSLASQSGTQLLEFGKLAARQLGPWGFPLGAVLVIAGLANTFKHARTTFWMIIVMVVCDMAYSLSYTIEEDKDAYYLPAFIALIVAIGFGLRWLLRYALARLPLAWRSLVPVALAGLVLPALALAGNWAYDNRRHYWIAQDYIDNILGVVEPNSLLLNQDWQVQSPMLYTREVEQRRRDVKAVDLNLMNHSWYIDYLRAAYPDLMQRSRDKVDAFVTQLVLWEHDPASFQRDPARLRVINFTFNELCQAFVTNELKVAPVYITTDLLERTPQNKEVTEWLIKKYQLVPRGLVFRLFEDQDYHAPGEPFLRTRGLADGTLSFEKDDVVRLKVLPVYTGMLVNRGRYLAAANQPAYAIEAYRQALKLDPDLEVARQELDKSLDKMRDAETTRP